MLKELVLSDPIIGPTLSNQIHLPPFSHFFFPVPHLLVRTPRQIAKSFGSFYILRSLPDPLFSFFSFVEPLGGRALRMGEDEGSGIVFTF